jgi:hypothetical protein
MAETKRKGDIAEAMIMAEALRRGYKVAMPVGEDWRYDLIVLRNDRLERVQCKYTESDGKVVLVRCASSNNWGIIKYTSKDVDWLAVYDAISSKFYFLPSHMLGDGRRMISLRLVPADNGQTKNVLWAKDFETW